MKPKGAQKVRPEREAKATRKQHRQRQIGRHLSPSQSPKKPKLPGLEKTPIAQFFCFWQ